MDVGVGCGLSAVKGGRGGARCADGKRVCSLSPRELLTTAGSRSRGRGSSSFPGDQWCPGQPQEQVGKCAGAAREARWSVGERQRWVCGENSFFSFCLNNTCTWLENQGGTDVLSPDTGLLIHSVTHP